MAVATSTRLKLFLRCEKLKDMDTFSKSDPYCVLYAVVNGRRASTEMGRTETMKDALSPQFTRTFTVDFFFEQKQEYEVVIFDDDGQGPKGDDSLGTVRFQLAHVVGSRNSTLEVKLKAPYTGSVFITGKEESTMGRDTIKVKFAGHGLAKMDLIGKSDPYYILQRKQPNGTFKNLFQSAVIDKTLDPKWGEQAALRIADLTGNDMDEQSLRFRCYDKDTFSDDEMGWFDFSVNDLRSGQRDRTFFKLKDQKGKEFGDISVETCEILHYPTFVELLGRGLQMNLTVSVDFTGSNGDPRQPRSLHYMNPQQPNQYVRAIMSVGEILMEYDSDKQVPSFGFGAQLPNGQVSHFFNLTLQENPYVQGVPGVLDAYSRCLQSVRLAGPTNFSETVTAVSQTSRTTQGAYTVLLILTDGEITDMEKTIRAIVASDDAPLSIIIVGVGNGCDFQMMAELDADGQKLRHGNHVMKRDIVQFVPFRDFVNAAPGALAAEVLREVPGQVVDWAIATGYAKPQCIGTGEPARA